MDVVEDVFANPGILPIIAFNEVGTLKSVTNFDCGMAIQETSNRPLLKIFNEHGGTVEEEDISKKESGKKYLVLRNKRTNKVKIYASKITYLKKPDYYKLKTFEDQSMTNKDQEFNSVFGTKKLSRMSKLRSSQTVDVTKNIFDNISSSSSLLEMSNSQLNEFSLYLPLGCNRFATKIECVYPISTLLCDNEIDMMTDYAKEVISMLPIKNDNEDLSKFFITNINNLVHKTIQNICLLTLADGLVAMLKTKSTDFNFRDFIVYPNCEVINDKILDNFVVYSSTGRDFTSKMKDKAVCFIIIIMILINMNCIDLSTVSPFLPASSQKRLILLMRVVGATPLKEDKTKYTLKIPLALLPSVQKPSKKKR